ncbi:MAG: Lrp/AsnC ligand binding domain-containing protein [Thermoplasmata archaeon]
MSETASNYDEIMAKYYGEESVIAMILLKVDAKELESAALELVKFKNVEDVFLVTGDTDIVVKARFGNYGELKEFVLSSLAGIKGLKESKTLLVVTTYKDCGKITPSE